MDTIGDITSRVRSSVKAQKQDAFVTDRFLFSIVLKYAKVLIKQEDNRNRIMRFNSLFEPLPCQKLIEVDRIEACCSDIRTGCTFRRTKDKLPGLLEGTYGPLIRTVSSIDGSVEVFVTEPGTYRSMTNTTTFKYNKNKYYWYLNEYLYFPNLDWEAVRVEGIFKNSVAMYTCDSTAVCQLRQDDGFHIPDYLLAAAEQMARQELLGTAQLPGDGSSDKQNILR
jgi:hypothetical protein